MTWNLIFHNNLPPTLCLVRREIRGLFASHRRKRRRSQFATERSDSTWVLLKGENSRSKALPYLVPAPPELLQRTFQGCRDMQLVHPYGFAFTEMPDVCCSLEIYCQSGGGSSIPVPGDFALDWSTEKTHICSLIRLNGDVMINSIDKAA